MDTFMDKLAQKFTAQEMIKANTAADMAEVNSLKAQNAEYEALYEKLKSISEQQTSKGEEQSRIIEENVAKAEQSAARVEQSASKVEQGASKVEQSAEKVEQGAWKVEQGAERMEQSALTVGQNIEKVEQSAAKVEQSADKVEQGAVRVDHGARRIEQSAVKVEQSAEKFEQGITKVEQGADKVEQAAARTEELISAAIAKIEEIKGPEEAEENTEELNVILEELKNLQTEQYTKLSEHMHKESVKVYRNVQAVVIDETAKYNGESARRILSISKQMKGVVAISVVALLASAASLVFQILTYLHII